MSMSSTESSDNENIDLLREAIDSQFINDSMFNQQPKKKEHKTRENISRESLRPKCNEEDQFVTYGVSDEFKQFLANKLSESLEKELNRRTIIVEKSNLSKKRKLKGIKLFKSSTVYIKKVKAVKYNPVRKLERRTSLDSDVEDKCAQVAVHYQDILDKTDVKNWSTRSKAQVFKYKQLKNGVISSID